MHRTMLRLASLVILVVFVLPSFAQVAQQGEVNVPRLRAKLLGVAYIEGKLTQIDEAESRFTFQYTNQVKKTDPKEFARLTDISRRFNLALPKRNTGLDGLRKLQEQGRAAWKAAYPVDETPVLFELKGNKGLAIRSQLPPKGENGKPRRLTPAEQKEMRRVPSVPGYAATPMDLSTEVRVRVYLDRPKIRFPAKTTEETVLPLIGIVIVPEPKPKDPFVIPGE
jgi:hypothetical protein